MAPRFLDQFEDGNPYRSAVRVRILAPRDSVWSMLSRSSLARRWSVIVHHIDLLSGRDGQVGAVRRCYLCPRGTFDERVEAENPREFRKLLTVAVSGMPGILKNVMGSCAYQNLEAVGPDQTELQLTVTYRLSYGLANEFVNLLAARPRLTRVLRMNVLNMKALVESGERYRRVYRFIGDERRCKDGRAVADPRRRGAIPAAVTAEALSPDRGCGPAFIAVTTTPSPVDRPRARTSPP